MKKIYIILFTGFLACELLAQDSTSGLTRPIGIKEYLAEVAKSNLGYITRQFDSGIARAAVRAARVYTNPEFSAGYTDNQDHKSHLGQTLNAGFNYSVNLGNVRLARIGLAQSESDLAELVVQAYFQNLRADAALVYYSAVKEKLLAEVQEDNYQRMSELAKADSLRFIMGTIMESDARQSAIEARIQKNEVIRANAAWKVSLLKLAQLRSLNGSDTIYQPEDSLELSLRDFPIAWLIDQAKNNRIELQSAIQSRIISENMLKVITASRAAELGLETGLSYSTMATNEIAPSPQHYSFNAGLTIPIKFSNINKGELEASELAIKQQEFACRDVELIILTEVNQAFILYQSQKKQLEEFHSGLLTEAETILNSKIYSYKRGETSLLDVLNAQRTYNEIRKNFYETHYEYLAALIELERSTGIWDIE